MNKEEIMKEIEHIANCKLYDTIGVKYLKLNIEKLFEENKHLNEQLDVALKYYDDAITRIDKAIEYYKIKNEEIEEVMNFKANRQLTRIAKEVEEENR